MKLHSALALATLVLVSAGPPPNTTGSYQRILGFDGGAIIPVQLDLTSLNPDGGPLQVQVVGPPVSVVSPGASAVEASTQVSLNGASTQVLADRDGGSHRVSATICNIGAASSVVICTEGATATPNSGIIIGPGTASLDGFGGCQNLSDPGMWQGPVACLAVGVDGGVAVEARLQ